MHKLGIPRESLPESLLVSDLHVGTEHTIFDTDEVPLTASSEDEYRFPDPTQEPSIMTRRLFDLDALQH